MDAEIGVVLVPHWTGRIGVDGVVYRPLVNGEAEKIEDENRDRLIDILKANLPRYSARSMLRKFV